MILGYQRPLSPLDLWKLDEERSSGHLADKLSENFERRKEKVEKWNAALDDGSYVPSFGRKAWWRVRKGVFGIGRYDGRNTVGLAGALSDTFFWPFWSAGFIKIVGDVAAVLSPLVSRSLHLLDDSVLMSHSRSRKRLSNLPRKRISPIAESLASPIPRSVPESD